MKIKLKNLLFVVFITLSLSAKGQADNILQYLDDGNMTKATDILFFDVSQLVRSNIMVLYEHRFNDVVSLQGGVGLLLYNQYKPLIDPAFRPDPLNPDLNNGISFCLKPLALSSGFNSFFVALPIKYQLHPGQAGASEIGLSGGRRWHLKRHFTFELEGGISIVKEKSFDGKSYIYDKSITEDWGDVNTGGRILFPLSFKIGYVF